jgi:TonB family protein
VRRASATTLLVLAALVAGAGCSKERSSNRDVLPPSFVVPEGARKLVASRHDWNPDGLSASYVVRVAYPAERLVAQIREKLECCGWKPVPADEIDARRPSSLRFEWRSHVLRDPGQKGEFFNWSGEWSNDAGDVVNYWLQYQSGVPAAGREGTKPDNEDLRVSVSLTPQKLVPVETLPASLIVLDGARDVRAWRDRTKLRLLEHGTSVRYLMKAAYPPSGVMASLSERLGKQGWTSQARRVPNLPSASYEIGWNADKRRLAHEQQFLWESRWENAAGDHLKYVLTQSGPLPPPGKEPSAPDDDRLVIEATLLSAGRHAGVQPRPSPAVAGPPCGTAVVAPVLIQKIEPAYPAELRKRRIAGVVIAEGTIATDGSVEDIRVLKSPSEDLSAVATSAFRQWRYKPALCDGNPIRVYVTVTFTFRLHE